MIIGGTRYNYVRNAQNDIVGLIDSTGKRVVSYKYDSWGKVVSITGTLAATVGQKNPFRYRGYYFDAESGMYYLQSRYYDPEIRRFISADAMGILNMHEDLYNRNLYVYCDGNAVSRADEIGRLWLTIASRILDVAVAVAVATVYVMDVIGNIQNKEGLDILRPTSSIGEYAAVGVAALISIPGIKGAIVRSTGGNCISRKRVNKQAD